MIHRLPARKTARLLRAEAEFFSNLGCFVSRIERARMQPSNAAQRREFARNFAAYTRTEKDARHDQWDDNF